MTDTIQDECGATVASGNRGNKESVAGPMLAAAAIFIFLQPVMQVVGVFLLLIFTFGQLGAEAALTIALVGADIGILVLIHKNLHSAKAPSLTQIGWRRPVNGWPENLLLITAILAISLVFEYYYVEFIGEELQQGIVSIFHELAADNQLIILPLFVVTVTLGAPLVEELVFRGYLQGALVNYLPPAFGLLLASVIFAAVHMDIEAFPVLLVSGLGLGYLFHRSKSVFPPMILHFLGNGLATVAILGGF